MTVTDILLLLVGRQFLLPGGGWLMLGRDEKDNARLAELAEKGDAVLTMEERPGPIALLRRAAACYTDQLRLESDLRYAAGLVVRYGRKVRSGPVEAEVVCTLGETTRRIVVEPLADPQFQGWML